MPGQPLLNRHQLGGVSRSPYGLFAQQEREPTRGRPARRGKGTYGGRSGQRVEEQGTLASRTRKHREAGNGRPVDRGAWIAKRVKQPRQQPAQPQYANYWVPLTRKRHTRPHLAQPRHTNHWAPRTRKHSSKSTGRSGQQKAATRRNMRREERVTAQGPVKKQQPDGMSHRGGGFRREFRGKFSSLRKVAKFSPGKFRHVSGAVKMLMTLHSVGPYFLGNCLEH